MDKLSAAIQGRLTLVVAEAGYGKTTLLADFAARSAFRTLWYRLDPSDGDTVAWTSYLLAAAQEGGLDIGGHTHALIPQVMAGGPPKAALISSLLGELGRLEADPTLLVLDDYQAVADNAEATAFLCQLIQDSPPWLRILISSRRRPSFELTRLAATRNLTELGTTDLRFSHDEIRTLFDNTYQTHLDPDVLTDIDIRTQGWIASLQLFYGSIRGRPQSAIRAMARSLSGAKSPIYDFLAEEVTGHLTSDLEDFLLRASTLDRITPVKALAAMTSGGRSFELRDAVRWIEEAYRLTLLDRITTSDAAHQMHPLMREFLKGRLSARYSTDAIRNIHACVAHAVATTEPLVAAHHYLEAGDHTKALDCLAASVMHTMGSGEWGAASDLLGRIRGTIAYPSLVALRARQLVGAGRLTEATAMLRVVDLTEASADVRAVVRQTQISLGWRTGDRDLIFSTLAEIEQDDETPVMMREIFQISIDTSPLAPSPVTYDTLAQRMERMAHTQCEAGHGYYSAISLHNAAIAAVAAGHINEAVRLGHDALVAFERLSYPAAEKHSTYAVLTNAFLELEDTEEAANCVSLALDGDMAHADVHTELAFLFALIGQRERAESLLMAATDLKQSGLSDMQADTTSTFAEAILSMPADPQHAIALLRALEQPRTLDVGDSLARDALEALAWALLDDKEASHTVVDRALIEARRSGARSAEARLHIVCMAIDGNGAGLAGAIRLAADVGALGLLQNVDLVAASLHLLTPIPEEVRKSIGRWRSRWLPALRRQLDGGDTPRGHAAAGLLDEFGDASDVVRLRAYAKVYSRRGPRVALGKSLSLRVAPRLWIQDLGRVQVRIGDHEVALSRTRRKSASLLMYLITRPGLTATREQVLDQLWPDADPTSASNSLNQALYFLRHDLDTWYEDDVSVDYIRLQSDLVWIDTTLSSAASVDLVRLVRDGDPTNSIVLKEMIGRYVGPFAPEFEYEEWAIAYRSRVHAAFLGRVNAGLTHLTRRGDWDGVRDSAIRVLEVAPDAEDIEWKLIAAYWRLGAKSAAAAQHANLAARNRADGVEAPSLAEIVESSSTS